MKFRKKPVVIDAVKWDCKHSTLDKLKASGCQSVSHEGNIHRHDECTGLSISTLEGSMQVSEGDWIIKGIKGEFYPCKPEIFKKTYKAAVRQHRAIQRK